MKLKTLLIVCSDGGHLSEALALSSAFEGFRVLYVTYESLRAPPGEHVYLPNVAKRPILLPLFAYKMGALFWRERPVLLLSTGSEIAIPFFYLAKLLRVKTVFIETIARTRTRSFTGKCVYRIADVFLVQWASLLSVYGPRARYVGGILDQTE